MELSGVDVERNDKKGEKNVFVATKKDEWI